MNFLTTTIRLVLNRSTTAATLLNQSRLFTKKTDYRKLMGGILIRVDPNMTIEEKKEYISAQMEVMKERGIRVPNQLNQSDWDLILSEPTRINHNIFYLARKSHNKELRRQEMEEREHGKKVIVPGQPVTTYPGYKTFVKHMSESPSEALKHYAISAFRNESPKLVFDFQFESETAFAASWRSLVMQLLKAYHSNVCSKEPFRVYYVNLKKDGIASKFIKQSKMDLSKFMIVESEKSYLDLFERDELVYLSPNARYDMVDYDPNKTYIIGVLADKGKEYDKHTYLQAKREGIRCERLPIERYLNWGNGSKDLTLDQVTAILVDQQRYHDWPYSLRHAPERKLHERRETRVEKRREDVKRRIYVENEFNEKKFNNKS